MINYDKINEDSAFEVGQPVMAQCCPDCNSEPEVDDVMQAGSGTKMTVTTKCSGTCPMSWTAYAVAYWNGLRISEDYHQGNMIAARTMIDLQHKVKELCL